MSISMSFNIMSGSDWAYTLIFIVLVLMFTFPPVTNITSGLTIENLFSFIIGSEQKEFVAYHLRRSTLTFIIHSFIPLIYYIYICNASETLKILEFKDLFWKYYFQFSLLLPAFGCMIAIYWYQSHWNKHPIAENIFKASSITDRNGWRNIAVIINNEMKSLDKFVSGVVPSKKIIITDNWIVKTDLYSAKFAQQAHVQLLVEKCNVYPINTNRTSDDDVVGNISNSSHIYGEVQYLKIAVKHLQNKFVYFHFTINSNEYEDIKGKINAPLNHAKGIVIQQTLGEKFAIAFRDEVIKNPIPKNLGIPNNYLAEPCIGCSITLANVKLIQSCSESATPNNGETTPRCEKCHCRPMWCVECLGRWFASRQLVARKDPGVWMSQKASCPTCRSVFCLLDVVVLQE